MHFIIFSFLHFYFFINITLVTYGKWTVVKLERMIIQRCKYKTSHQKEVTIQIVFFTRRDNVFTKYLKIELHSSKILYSNYWTKLVSGHLYLMNGLPLHRAYNYAYFSRCLCYIIVYQIIIFRGSIPRLRLARLKFGVRFEPV